MKRVTLKDSEAYNCQFEDGDFVGRAFEPFDAEKYPETEQKLIEEFNSKAEKGNQLYYMARHREIMLASGLEAGMYIASFDRDENMTGFSFTEGTRKMLGYDGLEDLPDEFESWVKVLVPSEKDTLVKLFWDSVKQHRNLPEISHAEYRMVRKDGKIIWVTGAGKFIRREDDGSLEMYIGCYREITAEHENSEYLKIIRSIGNIFNFSLYIDMKDNSYKILSSNKYVDGVKKDSDAFVFLRSNVLSTVHTDYHKELLDWFRKEVVVSELKKNSVISKDFYSSVSKGWYKGIFLIADKDEKGNLTHIIYGCQDITEAKEKEIAANSISAEQLRILKSLSGIFYSLHLINLKDDSVIVYNAQNEVKAMVTKATGITKTMKDIMMTTTVEAYLKDCLYFSDLTTVADRMKNKKMISAQFMGKRVGWFEASFIAIEVEPDGRPSKVLFTTRVIDKEKQREEKLLQESNTDQLTGFYNRRAYEDTISKYKKGGWHADAVYISIDINGLKVVNDTIGHEAGDELILGACDCMRHSFGPYGTLYRTGGDEFIALINADKNKLEEIKADIEETCSRWSGKLVKSLSISCGYVYAMEDKNLNMHDITVLADRRMYEAKSRYYRKSGVDRRGQKDAYIALNALYTKILKINLNEDSFQVLNMYEDEKNEEKGYSESISGWLKGFADKGMVHPDDKAEYLLKTDTAYLKNNFLNNNGLVRILYRRKYPEGYRKVMMEIVPANDFSEKNLSLFLYVKEIG